MATVYPEITDKMKDFILAQKLFFVSSAPLSADGFVNCSPKGLDTFRIVGRHEVAYLDMTGSGIETVSHLKENGRIVIMFCSFEGAPKIVRLHGRGTVYEKGSAGYAEYEKLFPPLVGARSIIHVEVKRVSDSCGYGVPLYDYREQRDTMIKWAAAKGEEGIREYQQEENVKSLDGLSGMTARENQAC